jgi:hypothetical protein
MKFQRRMSSVADYHSLISANYFKRYWRRYRKVRTDTHADKKLALKMIVFLGRCTV